MTLTGLFSKHIEKTTTRCLRTLGTLKTALRRGLNQQRMFTLYRSLILSRVSYGSDVLAACPTTLEKLDCVHTAALRIITGSTRDTSHVVLRYMLDISSVPGSSFSPNASTPSQERVKTHPTRCVIPSDR